MYKFSHIKPEFKFKYEELGLNIVCFRKRKNLTQEQLAGILGIDKSHLSAIELGAHAPSMDLIFSICNKLGISEKELFDFR